MARAQCAYGTAKLEFSSLEAATHCIPSGWDFERDGAWSCSWCDEVVYTAPGQMVAAVLALEALRARASCGDPAVRKAAKLELDKKLKSHAETHGDAVFLEPLIMKNKSGTKVFIVDPMHCLELNLLKTLWKYSFGDRMTAADCELVAEYLMSIGLHLDIKEKGKRDPGQKWFSAAQVDEFVLGTDYYKKSKSPGLIKNILAFCELVFDKHTVADSLTAAAEPDQPPAKKAKATSRKDRHKAPISGSVGAAEVAAAGIDPTSTAHLSLDGLQGAADLDSKELVLSYIRKKYGNLSGTIIQILTAYEAYGMLFSAWRAPWTSDSDEYRAKRSLQLARAARDFQAALNSLSNYKQKSWYTHLTTWIVWQQVWQFGNLWQPAHLSQERRWMDKMIDTHLYPHGPYAMGALDFCRT